MRSAIRSLSAKGELWIVVSGAFGWFIASSLFALVHPTAKDTLIGLGLATAASIVNPIYEESLLCGYLVAVGKGAGRPIAAVNGSIAIRMLFDLTAMAQFVG